jgi:hypothetical protein
MFPSSLLPQRISIVLVAFSFGQLTITAYSSYGDNLSFKRLRIAVARLDEEQRAVSQSASVVTAGMANLESLLKERCVPEQTTEVTSPDTAGIEKPQRASPPPGSSTAAVVETPRRVAPRPSSNTTTGMAVLVEPPSRGGRVRGEIHVTRSAAALSLFTIQGVLPNVPPGHSGWILVNPIGTASWWPHHGPLAIRADGSWELSLSLGARSPGVTIALALADEQAGALLKQYMESSAKRSSYPGQQLPDGVEILATAIVQ